MLDELKPFAEILDYLDDSKYYCSAIVFDPVADGLGHGYVPHICITETSHEYKTFYFEIPSIIAYYASVHRGFTGKGREDKIQEGRRQILTQFKALIDKEL